MRTICGVLGELLGRCSEFCPDPDGGVARQVGGRAEFKAPQRRSVQWDGPPVARITDNRLFSVNKVRGEYDKGFGNGLQ